MHGEDRVTFEMPDGWHAFEVVRMDEKRSKQGNEMFVAKVVSAEDAGIGTDVYLVAEKGKRWFLKQLLSAVGIEPDEEGNMSWDLSDVEGHTVLGKVEHKKEDDWTDRNNVLQPGKLKARIVEFKKLEVE
jgi:hypothetical protein